MNYSYILPFIYSSLFVRKFYYILRFFDLKNKFNYFGKYKSNNNYIESKVDIKLVRKVILYVNV